MACLSYFIVHSPCTCDSPMHTQLEWLVHRILSFTVRAHATLRRIQNLNGLSIVFYRLHSAHTRRSDVYIDYRQVWDSLRLAPTNTFYVVTILVASFIQNHCVSVLLQASKVNHVTANILTGNHFFLLILFLIYFLRTPFGPCDWACSLWIYLFGALVFLASQPCLTRFQ